MDVPVSDSQLHCLRIHVIMIGVVLDRPDSRLSIENIEIDCVEARLIVRDVFMRTLRTHAVLLGLLDARRSAAIG